MYCLLILHYLETVNIVILGRTGDGKSHLCQSLAMYLDPSLETTLFKESSGVESHTLEPQSWTGPNNIMIMDTPGLMDTGGIEKDKDNIVKIVKHVAALGSVNAVCLIVNEQAPRFDAGMQDAGKLLIDSFGAHCILNMGIIFNKSNGEGKEQANKKKSLELAKAITALITKRTGISLSDLPSWQFSYNREALEEIEMPNDKIEKRMAERKQTLKDIIQWAQARIPFDTRNAKPGEYELVRIAREANEKTKEANEKTKEAERLKAIEMERADYERQRADDERQRARDERKRADEAYKQQLALHTLWAQQAAMARGNAGGFCTII